LDRRPIAATGHHPLSARSQPEGCDVYIQPFAGDRNAGYILVDLDHADASILETMRTHGHDPCVVLQTSPAHLQAWIRLSASPLEPAVATAAAKQLARAYGGDMGSADWRHLGRLAGFTNRKPARRTHSGHAPWVKIVYARAGMAGSADTLLQFVTALPRAAWLSSDAANCSPTTVRDRQISHPPPSPPHRPLKSTEITSANGASPSAFLGRIGASWTCGWPAACCGRACPQLRSKPSSD